MKKKFSINTLIPILSFLILFCVFLIATRGTLVTPQNISNIVSQAFPVIIGGTGVLFVTAMGSTPNKALLAKRILLCSLFAGKETG